LKTGQHCIPTIIQIRVLAAQTLVRPPPAANPPPAALAPRIERSGWRLSTSLSYFYLCSHIVEGRGVRRRLENFRISLCVANSLQTGPLPIAYCLGAIKILLFINRSLPFIPLPASLASPSAAAESDRTTAPAGGEQRRRR
jgi:hypothetical protein